MIYEATAATIELTAEGVTVRRFSALDKGVTTVAFADIAKTEVFRPSSNAAGVWHMRTTSGRHRVLLFQDEHLAGIQEMDAKLQEMRKSQPESAVVETIIPIRR